MKKILLLAIGLFVSTSYCDLNAQADITLGNVAYTIDTLETFQCGPGSEYIAIQMRRVSDRQGRLDAYILKVDSKNPYISFEEVLGSGKVVGTERPSDMAARNTTGTKIFFGGTNGDFFVTQGDVGKPVGVTIVNNEFATFPDHHEGRRIGAIDEQMRGAIGNAASFSGSVTIAGETKPIKRVNYSRGENELVLYNIHNGTSTNTNEHGTELLVQLVEGDTWHTNCDVKAVVKTVENGKGNMSLTAGMNVLSGHGEMATFLATAKEGDTIAIQLAFTIDGEVKNIAQCIGGDTYALIVENGQVVESNFWDEQHPRTAFGQSAEGDTLLFCVVDGRGKSVGCNTQDLGAIMHHYGAYKAVNWDGGGSSCMYLQHFGQVNNGSDGWERSVGNAMFAVATLPEEDSTIIKLRAYSSTLNLPKYGVHTPKILGYNQYEVLLDPNVQGVEMVCDPEVGYVNEDGAFVCLGNGVITLKKDNASGQVQVRLVENVEIGMRLDTVIVYDKSNYPVEVVSTVGKNVITIQPSALEWSVKDETIATIDENGLLNGVANGVTEIYGSLNGQIDTLAVKVMIPESNPLCFDDFVKDYTTRWEMKASNDKWGAAMQEINGKANLYMNYTAGRQANIRFATEQQLYSAPNELLLRMTPQGDLIEKITIGLRAANGVNSVNYSTENIAQDQPMEIVVDLDSLFAVKNDIAIYPVTIEFITFAFNTKAEKKEYNIPIDGIYLTYNDGKETTDMENVSVTPAAGDNVGVKFVQGGHLYIMRNGKIYTILGTQIQ